MEKKLSKKMLRSFLGRSLVLSLVHLAPLVVGGRESLNHPKYQSDDINYRKKTNWLLEDPACSFDQPTWKELRHFLYFPDQVIPQNIFDDAKRDYPLFSQYRDWKRMVAADLIDRYRGHSGNLMSDLESVHRCPIGSFAFFYYLIRFKLYVTEEIEIVLQLYRYLDKIMADYYGDKFTITSDTITSGEGNDHGLYKGYHGLILDVYNFGMKLDEESTGYVNKADFDSDQKIFEKIKTLLLDGEQYNQFRMRVSNIGGKIQGRVNEVEYESPSGGGEIGRTAIVTAMPPTKESFYQSQIESGGNSTDLSKFNLVNVEVNPDPNSAHVPYLWPISSWMITELWQDMIVQLGSLKSGMNKINGLDIGNTYSYFHSEYSKEELKEKENNENKNGLLPNSPLISGSLTLSNAFRVYVYDPINEVPELRKYVTSPSYCRSLSTGAEVDYHEWFLGSNARTENPLEADFFFVPFYGSCIIHTIGENTSNEKEIITKLIHKSLSNLIHGGYLRFFQRSNGRDHIFVLPEGIFGANSVEYALNIMDEIGFSESIFLMPGIKELGYNYAKDIAIPSKVPLSILYQQYAASLDIDIKTIPEKIYDTLEDDYSTRQKLEIHKKQGLDIAFIRMEELSLDYFKEGTSTKSTVMSIDGSSSTRIRKQWSDRSVTGWVAPKITPPRHTEDYYNYRTKRDKISRETLESWIQIWKDDGKKTSGKTAFGDFLIQKSNNYSMVNDINSNINSIYYPASSKFCLLPETRNTDKELPRILFANCIPFVLSDTYELPFQGLFAQMSVSKGALVSGVSNSGVSGVSSNSGNSMTRFDWLLRWPQNKVDRDLAVYLRQFSDQQANRILQNVQKIRCWYFYPPSVLHHEFVPQQLNKVCDRWQKKNVFLGVHRLLTDKKSISKLTRQGFYLPNPKTGTFNLVTKDFLMIERTKNN